MRCLQIKKNSAKCLGITTGIFTVLNLVWLYLYQEIGISFDFAFQLGKAMQLFNIQTALLLISTGFVLSGALMTIHYFNRELDSVKIVMAGIIGSFIPALILFPFFKNQAVFFLMISFYALGVALQAYLSHPEKKEGKFRRLKYGWGLSKKAIYTLSIGGFLVGLLMTSANLQQRQGQLKSSLMNVTKAQTQQMNLTGMSTGGMGNVSRDWFVENIFKPEILPEYNKSLQEKYDLTWSDLTQEEQDNVMNNSYNNFKESYGEGGMATNIQSTIVEQMQDKVSEAVINSMFEQVPMLRIMLQALPVITGLVISSFVLLYGTLFISPFCALIELFIPLERSKRNGEDSEGRKRDHRKEDEFTGEKQPVKRNRNI